jgi:hypothetical protein
LKSLGAISRTRHWKGRTSSGKEGSHAGEQRFLHGLCEASLFLQWLKQSREPSWWVQAGAYKKEPLVGIWFSTTTRRLVLMGQSPNNNIISRHILIVSTSLACPLLRHQRRHQRIPCPCSQAWLSRLWDTATKAQHFEILIWIRRSGHDDHLFLITVTIDAAIGAWHE